MTYRARSTRKRTNPPGYWRGIAPKRRAWPSLSRKEYHRSLVNVVSYSDSITFGNEASADMDRLPFDRYGYDPFGVFAETVRETT